MAPDVDLVVGLSGAHQTARLAHYGVHVPPGPLARSRGHSQVRESLHEALEPAGGEGGGKVVAVEAAPGRSRDVGPWEILGCLATKKSKKI